jgi:hypothetical protein
MRTASLDDWSSNAPRPTNPTARPSKFADWVFQHSMSPWSSGSSNDDSTITNRFAKKAGVLDHALIDLSIQTTWLINRIGRTSPSDWVKEYVDGFYQKPEPLLASKLLIGDVPLRGKPDVILRNKNDGTVLIIERKTTRRLPRDIPDDGWPNVEAQLWCYSWIDKYVDAPDVLMLGQLWRDRQLSSVHFLWRRSDQNHHTRCRTWFERYGGTFI